MSVGVQRGLDEERGASGRCLRVEGDRREQSDGKDERER